MEIGIGDEVTLVKRETYITGRIRGIRLSATGDIEVIWLEEMDIGFYLSDDWLVAEDFTEEDLAEIEKLNQMLKGEEEEDGEI